jgi:hypothetical protein
MCILYSSRLHQILAPNYPITRLTTIVASLIMMKLSLEGFHIIMYEDGSTSPPLARFDTVVGPFGRKSEPPTISSQETNPMVLFLRLSFFFFFFGVRLILNF